jgi:hypothetical protein
VPDDDSDDEVSKGLRNTGITMGATLTGLAIGGPLCAVIGAGLGELTKLVLNEKAKYEERREVLATAHIAWGLELPEGEGQQKALAGIMADPVSAETIVQSFQRMVDATSSSAWPCIALLTGDYVRAGKPVDGFFHDAVAVLASLDDEGLAAAEALFAKAEPHKDLIGRGKRVEINYNGPPHNNLTFTEPRRLEPTRLEKREHITQAPAGVQRSLRILGANGFGQVRGDRIMLGGETTEESCWRLLGYLRRRAQPDASPAGLK